MISEEKKIDSAGKFYTAKAEDVFDRRPGDILIMSDDRPIVLVFYNGVTSKCCFTSYNSNMQDYILSWDDYCDFVKLLDSSYDKLYDIYQPEINDD